MNGEMTERFDANLLHLCQRLQPENATRHPAAEKSITQLDILSLRSNVWTEVMSSVTEQVRLARAVSMNRSLDSLVLHPIQVAPSLISADGQEVDKFSHALDLTQFYAEHIRHNHNLKTLHLNRIEDYGSQPLLSKILDYVLDASASSTSLQEITITRRPHRSPLCNFPNGCDCTFLNVQKVLSKSKSLRRLSITTGSPSTFSLSLSKLSYLISKKPYYIVQGIGSGLSANPHSRLQHLSVSGGYVSDDELFEILTAAQAIRTLSSLKIQLLSDVQIELICNELLVLPECPVEYLDLSGSIFSSEGSLATLLSGLVRNKTVKTLVLDNALGMERLDWKTQQTRMAWQALASLNSTLESISFAHNKLEDDAVVVLLETLGNSPISKLDLRGSSIDLCKCSRVIQNGSQDTQPNKLERLYFGAINVSSAQSMEMFCKVALRSPCLKELDLGLVYSEEPKSDCLEGFGLLFDHLAESQGGALEKLSMTVLAPLPHAAGLLERFVHNTTLKSLTIHGPLFEDDANDFSCFQRLLQHNQTLEYLDLSNNRSGSTPLMLRDITEGLRLNRSLRTLKLQNVSALTLPCWTLLWNNLFEVLTVNRTLEVLDLEQSFAPVVLCERKSCQANENENIVIALINHLPRMRGLRKLIVNNGASEISLSSENDNDVARSFLDAVEQNYTIEEICGISMREENRASQLEYTLLLNQAGRDRFLRGNGDACLPTNLPAVFFDNKETDADVLATPYSLSILYYFLRQGNVLKECCRNIS